MDQTRLERKAFWTAIFEKENIAPQLVGISRGKFEEIYHLSGYGETFVNGRPASILGDNFMSDTFIIDATTANGSTFASFVKVNRNSQFKFHFLLL